MAYNQTLADRIREHLVALPHIEEKEMMGGLAFLLNGKMCVGVVKEDLMCRIGSERYDWALEQHGCRPMDFTGKPMKGWVFVEAVALNSGQELSDWIALCIAFNASAKSSKKK